MRLERVTRENYQAALALSVRPDQEDLVEPTGEHEEGETVGMLDLTRTA